MTFELDQQQEKHQFPVPHRIHITVAKNMTKNDSFVCKISIWETVKPPLAQIHLKSFHYSQQDCFKFSLHVNIYLRNKPLCENHHVMHICVYYVTKEQQLQVLKKQNLIPTDAL